MLKPNPTRAGFLMAVLLTISACKLQNASHQSHSPGSIASGGIAPGMVSSSMPSLYASGGRFDGFTPDQELVGKRAENAKHFQNADGTYTVQIGNKMHYQSADGSWQDIDMNILKGSSLPDYAYQNETNMIKTYFPETPGKTGILMKLQDGTDFSWWSQPKMRITDGGMTLASKTPAAAEGLISQEKLVYPNLYPEISEEVVILSEGMESSTILHSLTPELRQLAASAQLEFEHFIPLSSGWQVFGDGQLQSGDFEADHLHIRIPGHESGIYFGRIIVFDNQISKEEAMLVHMPAEKLNSEQQRQLKESVHTVPYRIAFEEQGIRVTTALEASWLQDPSRKFPVTIDPTVTVTPTNSQNNFYGPLSHWFGYQRHASLYLQSEIGAYGSITQIEYNSTSTGVAGSRPTQVYMRSTANNTLSDGQEWNSSTYTGAGATLCLNANTDQGNTVGWKALALNTPFEYEDGNLLIMLADFWGGSGAVKYYNQSVSIPGRQAYSRQDQTYPGDGAVMTLENRLSEIRITYTPLITCVGTLSASRATICPNDPFTLTLADFSSDPGTTFQWQSSSDGGTTWTNLGTPQNLPTYTVTQIQETSYRAIATCTVLPEGDISNVVTVSMEPLAECYCVPALDCSDSDVIYNVTMGGINNSSGCAINGYTDYTSSVPFLRGMTFQTAIQDQHGQACRL